MKSYVDVVTTELYTRTTNVDDKRVVTTYKLKGFWTYESITIYSDFKYGSDEVETSINWGSGGVDHGMTAKETALTLAAAFADVELYIDSITHKKHIEDAVTIHEVARAEYKKKETERLAKIEALKSKHTFLTIADIKKRLNEVINTECKKSTDMITTLHIKVNSFSKRDGSPKVDNVTVTYNPFNNTLYDRFNKRLTRTRLVECVFTDLMTDLNIITDAD